MSGRKKTTTITIKTTTTTTTTTTSTTTSTTTTQAEKQSSSNKISKQTSKQWSYSSFRRWKIKCSPIMTITIDNDFFKTSKDVFFINIKKTNRLHRQMLIQPHTVRTHDICELRHSLCSRSNHLLKSEVVGAVMEMRVMMWKTNWRCQFRFICISRAWNWHPRAEYLYTTTTDVRDSWFFYFCVIPPSV